MMELGARHIPLAVIGVEDRVTMLIVVGSFLLMLIGIVFRHFSKDTNDYFRAGGRATWWILGGSLFMQGFSARRLSEAIYGFGDFLVEA